MIFIPGEVAFLEEIALAACNILASLSLPSALGKAKTDVGVDDRFNSRSLDPFVTNFDTGRALRPFVPLPALCQQQCV